MEHTHIQAQTQTYSFIACIDIHFTLQLKFFDQQMYIFSQTYRERAINIPKNHASEMKILYLLPRNILMKHAFLISCTHSHFQNLSLIFTILLLYVSKIH